MSPYTREEREEYFIYDSDNTDVLAVCDNIFDARALATKMFWERNGRGEFAVCSIGVCSKEEYLKKYGFLPPQEV